MAWSMYIKRRARRRGFMFAKFFIRERFVEKVDFRGGCSRGIRDSKDLGGKAREQGRLFRREGKSFLEVLVWRFTREIVR